jgi:PhnB protein
MRFLRIMFAAAPAANRTPDPAKRAETAKRIAEQIATGSIIATGGLGKRATSAARVTNTGGRITLEDPPSGDGWMAGGGFALIEAASKEEAIAQSQSALEMMGDGMLELIQVSEMHPKPKFVPYPAVGVIPYLNVVGAEDAGELYKKAFGATEIHRMPAQDGKRLMHLHLMVNGGSLMLSDVFPEHGYGHEPSGSYTMTLVLEDAKPWWDRAVAAGLEVILPFEKQMWGDTYGQLKDRFGVRWAINQPARA